MNNHIEKMLIKADKILKNPAGIPDLPVEYARQIKIQVGGLLPADLANIINSLGGEATSKESIKHLYSKCLKSIFEELKIKQIGGEYSVLQDSPLRYRNQEVITMAEEETTAKVSVKKKTTAKSKAPAKKKAPAKGKTPAKKKTTAKSKTPATKFYDYRRKTWTDPTGHDKKPRIGGLVRALLCDGKKPNEIVERVKSIFPNARTTVGSVAVARTGLIKLGLVKK